MNDKELINVYEKSYKEEFDSHLEMVNKLLTQSRDKKYALQFGLTVMAFVLGFRYSSKIENDIINSYEHNYKLGGSIVDLIKNIPITIESNKIDIKEWHNNNKNKISVEWKKLWGIIPYAVKQFHVIPNIRMGSPFENLKTESEIASELGKQRAMIDLVDQLKVKYIELGGHEEFIVSEETPFSLVTLNNLKTALSNNDLEIFFKIIQSIFASLPYDMKITEGYFHSHIHLILKLLGIKILSELETNKGRIDSVIESENYIHIIEFKQNDSSIAIEQIKRKQYYQQFLLTNKEIILVGVAVDTKERNIIDWQIVNYNDFVKI